MEITLPARHMRCGAGAGTRRVPRAVARRTSAGEDHGFEPARNAILAIYFRNISTVNELPSLNTVRRIIHMHGDYELSVLSLKSYWIGLDYR